MEDKRCGTCRHASTFNPYCECCHFMDKWEAARTDDVIKEYQRLFKGLVFENKKLKADQHERRKQMNVCVEKVIFNPPATIVIWSDKVKTIVKITEGDNFDPEKGLAMAISKRVFGNSGNYYNLFKKFISEDTYIYEDLANEYRADERLTFRETLQERLTDMKMTNVEFSELIGVTEHTVDKYLNGRSFPGERTLKKIAKVIGISVEYAYGE